MVALYWLALFFLCGHGMLLGQSANSPAPKVYALVIGISKYLDKRVPDLQFADADARSFAEYLRATQGGNVPVGQIRLLLNEKASFSEIDLAIESLYDSVKPGDRVYFYFSGHGDVETRSFANLGYLLAYNTPANNYTRQAIRLEDINLLARTLSAQRNAEIILITDACRSGKLAGGAMGSRWVGEALRRVERNEVRIASCLPDQLSQESVKWGGGHGVFSYYLLNGLHGKAVRPGSRTVTVTDLKTYLSSGLASDKILKAENVKQQPVVTGNPQIRLGTVLGAPVSPLAANALPASPLDTFKTALRLRGIELLIDFSDLKNATADQIRNRVFDGLLPTISTDDLATFNALRRLRQLANSAKNAAAQTNAVIASAISERGQGVINDYLAGDMAELERRNYYNIRKGVYDQYVFMYAAALKLLPASHILHERIKLASLYFEGLLCRLKMPLFEDSGPLLVKALELQQAALKMEPFAAYIHNELANLYAANGQADSAIYHFEYASKLSPTWAVPLANLAGIYNGKADIKKAVEYENRAHEIQPGLVSLMVNQGITAELEKNWLLAEEMALRSLSANPLHFVPYQRLGHVYTATTRYPLADSLFFEAWQRQKGYFFPKPEAPFRFLGFNPGSNIEATFALCLVVPLAEPVSSPVVLTLAGRQYTEMGNLAEAEGCFIKALNLEPGNFLAEHYYARYFLKRGRYAEAAYYFNRAAAHYRPGKIIDLLGGRYPDKPPAALALDDQCFKEEVDRLYFDSVQTQQYLFSVYRALGYQQEAEEALRTIIATQGLENLVQAYYSLAGFLMECGQWKKAEQAWFDFGSAMKKMGGNEGRPDKYYERIAILGAQGYELDSFYLKATARFPEDPYWAVQQAKHWYRSIMANPGNYYFKDPLVEDSLKGTPPIQWQNWFSVASILKSMAPDLSTQPLPPIQYPQPVRFPYRLCISSFQRAMALAADDETLGDLHLMLGDIFNATGQNSRAATQYAAAIEYRPHDAQLRRRAANSFQQSFMLSGAFYQLDTLRQKDGLQANDFLLYASMAIHARQFEKAQGVIERGMAFFTGPQYDSLVELKARSLYLQQKAAAIPYYADSIKTALPLPERLYAQATLYAQLGDSAKAFKYLGLALDNGFAYKFVLENDPVWENTRGGHQWGELIKGRTFKTYTVTDYSPAR